MSEFDKPDNRENNKEIARKMAHAQEDYARVNELKDAFGILRSDRTPDGIKIVTEAVQDKLQRNNYGADSPELYNLDSVLLHQGRNEIARAASAKVAENLHQMEGIVIDKHDQLVATAEISEDVAEKVTRTLDLTVQMVEHMTHSQYDKGPNDRSFRREVALLDADGSVSEAELQIESLVLEAVGLRSDEMSAAKDELMGMTSAGYEWSQKSVPTELPGIFYEYNTYIKGDEVLHASKLLVKAAELEPAQV